MITPMELLRGNILGIIDSHGAVHSKFTGSEVIHHGEEASWQTARVKWRWSHRQSIWWITTEAKPDEEQHDAIRRHLTKRFGLQWYDNGHHDIEDLLSRAYWIKTGDLLHDRSVDITYDVLRAGPKFVYISRIAYRNDSHRSSVRLSRKDSLLLSMTILS